MGLIARPPVAAIFIPFTQKFEGAAYWPYLDVKGLVTTGFGDLIDSVADAVRLPWVHKLTMEPMSEAEIATGWTTIKSAQGMAKLGGKVFAQLTDMRLTPGAVQALVEVRLESNERFLVQRFPEYSGWQCDAQLALLSLAWAAGPNWRAPFFDTAARALDFEGCAGPEGDAGSDYKRDQNDPAYHAQVVLCRGYAWLNDTGNPGLRPRNLANKILLENAALTSDSTKLVWPDKLSNSIWPDYLADL